MEVYQNCIYVDKNEIENLKPLKNGCGTYGQCYFLNDDTLLKLFYEEVQQSSWLYKVTDIAPLAGHSNETYVFPEKLAFCDEQFIGYTMQYIKGKTNLQRISNYNLDSFANAIKKVEYDTISLANKGIASVDVNQTNILFNNSFNIIDTDSYYFQLTNKLSDSDSIKHLKKLIYKDNIKSFYEICFEMINRDKNIKNFANYNKQLREMANIIKYYQTPIMDDYIRTLKKEVLEISDIDVETYSDMRKVLKRE